MKESLQYLNNKQEQALMVLKSHIQGIQETTTQKPRNVISISITHAPIHDEEITEENVIEVLFGVNNNSILGYGCRDLTSINIEGPYGSLNLLEWIQKFRPGIVISVQPPNSISCRGSSFYYRPEENPQEDSQIQYREEIHLAIPEHRIPEDPITFFAHLLHEFGHALQDRLEINKPLNDPTNPLTAEEREMVMRSEENATDFAIRVAKELEVLLGIDELSQNLKDILREKLENYRKRLFRNSIDEKNNEDNDGR